MILKSGTRFPEKIMLKQEVATVVNLRQARKRKARAECEIAAAQNRVLHGRTKAERMRDRHAAESARSQHEGNFREREPDATGKGE
jgi:hypothetical protein